MNYDNVSYNLSGWTLGDLNSPNAYSIPNGTIITANGTVTFNNTTLNFQINDSGETIYLKNASSSLIDMWSN